MQKLETEHDDRCGWSAEFGRCQMLATLNYFCAYHWDCKSGIAEATQAGFVSWLGRHDYKKRETQFDVINFDQALGMVLGLSGHKAEGRVGAIQKISESIWSSGDKKQIAGLILLGPGSRAWEVAPKEIREAAMQIIDNKKVF